MADHDQRLKELVKEFFPALLEWRLPAWLPRLELPQDVQQVNWLQQEVFGDPPQGERRVVDLVARVPLRQAMADGTKEVLVNIEIDSDDKATRAREQVYTHYSLLRRRYRLPVLSIAVYLRVGLEGFGQDTYRETWEELETLVFQFPYLGLPALDARGHVEGTNLLAVRLSVLMKIAEADRPWLKARAMQRIAQAELNVYQQHLLMECVEAYLPLTDPHLNEFYQLLLTPDFKEASMLAKTTYEKGIEKGLEMAKTTFEKGQSDILLRMIEDRFGALSESAQERLNAMKTEELRALALTFLHAKTLPDLGLDEHSPTSNGA